MTVFDVFPNAIISNVWELGELRRATEVGDRFEPLRFVDVILDDVVSGDLDQSPNADGLNISTMIYAKPEQLPSLDTARYISSYCFHNTESDCYYEIRQVGVGKNQQTGRIEHFEFQLVEKEVLRDE